jgi:hypothetical protein
LLGGEADPHVEAARVETDRDAVHAQTF